MKINGNICCIRILGAVALGFGGMLTSVTRVDSASLPLVKATQSCKATGATGTRSVDVSKAVPDDASDDTPAIQAAIDQASSGGGIVRLKAGTYLLNGHVRLKSNVRLEGAGPATQLKAGPGFLASKSTAGGYPVITTDGASNVTIADLTADQSGDTLNGNIDGRLSQYLIDVRNSRNAVVDGVYTRNPFTYSIVMVGTTQFCVRDSNTRSTTVGKYDQLDGIHILNSDNGMVLDNTVDQGAGGPSGDGDDGLVAHPYNGSVHDVVYAGNNVRSGRHGSGMQLAYTAASDKIYNLTIQNNRFWGSPIGIHTGTYGSAGSSANVTVGGSLGAGNIFESNKGNAVDFAGVLSQIVVTDNYACNSGSFKVGSGTGNVVRDNVTTCVQSTPSPTVSATPKATPSPTSQPGSNTADLNRDGKVDVLDLSRLLTGWGRPGADSDVNGDGTTDIKDLSILLSRWSN